MAEAIWTSTPAGKKQDDILVGEKASPISPISGSHQTSTASKMSPPKDSYWFAHAAEPRGKVRQVPKASPVEKDESLTQEQVSPSHKPNMDKQSDLHLEGVSPVEKLYVPPRAATPSRLDSYWFAHSGIDLSSPTADQASDSGFSDGKESSPPSLQRERKSQQEQDQYFEGRQKQPKQLRTFTAQTDSFQEYEHSYRQPKGEHYHDHIKYQTSEEKTSYIWDTKMESKEANLKQSFEQEAKLEARRNAQRNHLSFAFGSSTQENLSEDRSSISGHPSYQGSEIIFPIIRHIDEQDIHDDKRNDMSSYNLIQKIDDCMSRSMIITSTTRGRRKTDLVPVAPSSRNSFSRMPSPGNQAKRSVSMTRLDQLAQPRRHYIEALQEMGKNASSSGSHSFATSMSKSMYNVDSHLPANRKMLRVNSVSKSMLHLANHQPLASSNNFLSPNSQLCPASSLKNSKRLSQSMMQLSVLPRPTRASLLRAEALATAREKGLSSSMLLLNRNDAFGSRLSLVPAARKEPSQSPARPRSSLAAAAEALPEKSQTLKVTMRPKPKTRPRPVSIAGTVPDQLPKASTPITKDQTKPPRRSEKKGPATAPKPPSAKVSTSLAGSKVLSSQKVPETPVLKEEKEEKEIDQIIIPESDSSTSQPEIIATAAAESPVIQSDNVPESNKEDEMSTSFSKSRIISEEEAKAALQEKRRLAREQAEKEAELERIRQEEIRCQEEEQRRKEEEEQRRQEEEQLKLMAELQRQEEEKLKKAIEEREKKEEEERLKQEEENRLKAEREEQERIAREEAERQRIELAERLKREEEERAERKRRVEQIMSRTRGKSSNNQPSDASSDKSQSSSIALETAAKLSASGHLPSSILSALSSIHGGSLSKGKPDSASNNNIMSKSCSNIQETENNKHQSTVYTDSKRATELSQDSVSADTIKSQDNINNVTADFDQTMVINNVKESDKQITCDKAGNVEIHHQTNGYGDDNERSSNGLSHERSEPSVKSMDVVKAVQPSQSEEILDSNLEQVIQLEDNTRKTSVQLDDNLLNNVEDVNSNTVPGTPIVAFEEVRQPQASITG